MTAAEIAPLLGPGVYIWWRGDEALYVGASVAMLGRVGKHNLIGTAQPLLESDAIEFRPMESHEAALREEAALQSELRPRYSARVTAWTPRACLTCGKEFRPGRPWQKFCHSRCRTFTPERV